MNLTFEEAARGVNKTININVVETCWQCKGSKAAPGSKPETCPTCNGSGMVSFIDNAINDSLFSGI